MIKNQTNNIEEINNVDEIYKYTTFSNVPFFEMIANEYYNKGMKVLDVGAGKGLFAEIIGCDDIYLIDGNPITIDFLKRKYNNVYSHILPEKLPFSDNFFDMIHCSHLIEHIDPDTLYKSLKEFDRCLNTNGLLIISSPLLHTGFYDDLSHVKPYTPSVLLHYLSDPGLDNRTRATISTNYEIVRIQYRYNIELLPYLNISHSKKWIQNILIKIVNFLRKINCGYYKKTAYTIILRKNYTNP